MLLSQYFWSLVLLFTGGSLVAIFGPRRHKNGLVFLSLGLAFLGGAAAAAGALWFWQHPDNGSAVIFSIPEFINGLPQFNLTLYADRLACLFLLLAGVFTSLVSVYSWGWLKRIDERHRIAGVFNLFALFTLLTLLVDNVFFLLFFLEAMTLTFAYLVLYRHNKYARESSATQEDLERAKTAFKAYLIFSHIGLVLLTTSLMILAVELKSFDFASFRTPAPISPFARDTAFVLALIGLGIKAGTIPAHVWVPVVHPYSPTTTHAFSLGVTIKISIYLMIRIFFQYLPEPGWWWGGAVLAVAGLTALIGVFYAIVGRDLKTALASHTVENIGIMLAGLGIALVSRSLDPNSSLASLALVACLYHTINHAVFKGLLYLATGSIETLTGTVEFEKLGGLAKIYPWTSTAFLIGSFAISGFPPFNGFISEWLTLQSFFASMELFSIPGKPLFLNGLLFTLLLLAGLLFTLLLLCTAFGLTALAFVKIAGETLLGAPREPAIRDQVHKKDVPWSMRIVLLILSLGCLLLGMFPALVTSNLLEITRELNIPNSYLQADQASIWFQIPYSGNAAAQIEPSTYTAGLSPWLLGLAALIVLVPIAIPLMRLRSKMPTSPVWTGGSEYQPAAVQFTGAALTSLIWSIFGRQAKPGEKTIGPPQYLPARLFLTSDQYVVEIFRQGYNYLLSWILRFSNWFGNTFQNGDIRRYLLYILFVLVIGLIAVLPWGNR